jgi:uncharacterized protein involved in cysteine biosynthesis
VILGDFLKALAQIGDRRFRRVMWLGIALAFALLFAIYALFLWAIDGLDPGTITIPLAGEVRGVGTLLSFGSILFMIGLSVFLMVPVASAFTGLFLEDVAAAVEDRHYPDLPPVPRLPLWDVVSDSVNYFGLLVGVNAVALAGYIFTGPLIPVFFWALNGLLLGREYFMLVAMRRLGRQGARAMRARHFWRVWGAGTLMAVPLSVPILNLVIPVLGAATFTHLYHRLAASETSARTSRGRAR